jgi:tetratricopeptide (TPR) repeat protein
MKELYLIVFVFLVPLEGSGQTKDRAARNYYDNGCEKIITKDYNGAISDFTQAIVLDSNFIQAFENRGVAKFYLRNNRGAIEDYTSALKLNPDDYNTHGRRGWAEFYLQEYDQAIADFTKAIEGNRSEISYFNIRGQAKYANKDYPGAIYDLTIVIKAWSGEKSQKSTAYYWRGMAEIMTGQGASACLDFNKAKEKGYNGADEAILKYCQ